MPIRVNISAAKSVAEVRKTLIEKHRKTFTANAKKRMNVVGRILRSDMVKASPRFQGKLANSHGAVFDSKTLTLILFNTDARKAAMLHDGTRHKRQPPTEALKRWAKRKLGDERLAFVVARAIKRKGGLKARKWMRKAMDRKREYIRTEIRAIMVDTIREVNR